MSTQPLNISDVRRFPYFQSLSEDEAEALAQNLRPLRLPPDTVIFQQDDSGGTACLVLSGRVEIRLIVPTCPDRVLDTVGPGSIIGEISLLTGTPRTASAVTLTETELWEISHPALEQALAEGRAWATRFVLAMAETLALRLAAVDREIMRLNVEMGEWNRELSNLSETLELAVNGPVSGDGAAP